MAIVAGVAHFGVIGRLGISGCRCFAFDHSAADGHRAVVTGDASRCGDHTVGVAELCERNRFPDYRCVADRTVIGRLDVVGQLGRELAGIDGLGVLDAIHDECVFRCGFRIDHLAPREDEVCGGDRLAVAPTGVVS